MELLVANGLVYDPLNGVEGERMDLAVKDGKVVQERALTSPRVIDASGMVVMPGGVDIHNPGGVYRVTSPGRRSTRAAL